MTAELELDGGTWLLAQNRYLAAGTLGDLTRCQGTKARYRNLFEQVRRKLAVPLLGFLGCTLLDRREFLAALPPPCFSTKSVQRFWSVCWLRA